MVQDVLYRKCFSLIKAIADARCAAPDTTLSARGGFMPEKETIERAREDAREGKSPSTQAGEFVREEMHHIREGKNGGASPQRAIAVRLSKARGAGVKRHPPRRGKASARTPQQASRDYEKGQSHSRRN